MTADYAATLASFLERMKARAAEATQQAGRSAEDSRNSRPSPGPPLKFSLPSHLAPLGQEVIQLVSQGKTPEAIRKVEKAVAAAKYDYDRKALRALLGTLRGGAK